MSQELDQVYQLDEMPENQYEPIPAGWYEAKIEEAEKTANKRGTGSYVKARFVVTGPSHEGRAVFFNLNLQHENEKTVQIAQSQLGSIMRSAGLKVVKYAEDLVGAEMRIRVTVRTSEEYGDQNDIKGFKPLDGAQSVIPGTEKKKKNASKGSSAPWAQ